MPRISRETHKGCTITRQDFRNLHSADEGAAACDESRTAMRMEPEQSVLLLSDFSGSTLNPEIVAQLKQLAIDNKPYVKASAILGLSNMQQLLFQGVNRASERSIKWFSDEAEAKDWLAEQR